MEHHPHTDRLASGVAFTLEKVLVAGADPSTSFVFSMVLRYTVDPETMNSVVTWEHITAECRG